MHILRHKLRHC